MTLVPLLLALAAPPSPTAAPQPAAAVDTVPSVLHPSDGGLTADRVAARSLVDAPDVALRTAELEAAAARVDQARTN